MMPAILATVGAYIVIAVLLLSLNLASNWKWWIKAGAIGVTVLFFAGSYSAIVSMMGWPSPDKVPDRFQLLWARVLEPDKRTGDPGMLYVWVESLDENNVPSGRPRAFELPYSEELARRLREAQDKRQQGRDVAGTLEGDDPGNGASQGNIQHTGNGAPTNGFPFRGDEFQLTFQDLPAVVLPDKPLN